MILTIQKTFTIKVINENESIEIGEIDDIKYIFVDNIPCFMYYNQTIVFTLFGIRKYEPKENYVTVDMGAVKFVTSGADVMSPGIVDAYNGINKGDQVWICDVTHHKPIAVGIALQDGSHMKIDNKGKSVEVIHYVGDKIWNYFNK